MSRNKKNRGNNSNHTNSSSHQRYYNNYKNKSNETKHYNPTPESELVRRVQSQPGLGSNLILYFLGKNSTLHVLKYAAQKIGRTVTIEGESQKSPTKYQLKINNVVLAEAVCKSFTEAKNTLSELALAELQKVCFSIIKIDVRELPKVEIPSVNKLEVPVSGIGAKMMEKMGWSGKGLGSREQGRIEIVRAQFNVNRQGVGNKNITNEVRALLEQYSASQDLSSMAFAPDFTSEERAAIHAVAERLNLRSKSYGKGDQRFLIVENKIRSWDLINAVLAAGGETKQYKILTPTNFL